MDALILIAGLTAISAADAAWWWLHARHQQARIRRLNAQRDSALARCDAWADRVVIADQALTAATEELESLRSRNQMLSDLIGGAVATEPRRP